MSVLGVIPARYGSSRFPGKALASIAGKPMIQHVHERASAAETLDRVVIATDDDRIVDAVKGFGGEAVMTPKNCASGTDRCAYVIRDLPDVETVVNIQGDEPLLDPAVIDLAVRALQADPNAAVSTVMTPITNRDEFESPNNCKVVVGSGGRALYFSRSPIPSRARTEPERGEPWGMKHLGLYVYRRQALLDVASAPMAALENIEKLEQLRFLARGVGIVIVETEHDAIGVDTPEELAAVERLLAGEKRD